MIRVGSYVTGRDCTSYFYTTSEAIMEVVGVCNERIDVNILCTYNETRKPSIEGEYKVDAEDFVEVDPVEWVEEQIRNGLTLYYIDEEFKTFIESKIESKGGIKMNQKTVTNSILSEGAVGWFSWNELSLNETIASIREQIVPFFDRYGYNYEEFQIDKVIRKSLENKSWIINLFSKHPNWIPEKLMIRLERSVDDKIDYFQVEKFLSWIDEQLRNWKEEHQQRVFGFSAEQYMSLSKTLDSYSSDKHDLDTIKCNLKLANEIISHYYDGTENEEIKRELVREMNYNLKVVCDLLDVINATWKEPIRLIDHMRYEISTNNLKTYDNKLFTKQDVNKICTMESLLKEIKSKVAGGTLDKFIDEEFAGTLNYILPELKIGKGLKMSKVVGRICKWFGLDQIKEMKFVTHNGEEKEKDFGYNYQYPLFASAVNPIEIKRPFCISVNPVDFWLMSNGTGWRSCQTIDVNGVDRVDDSGAYHGQYSSGTESYMLDHVSFITYIIDPEYEGSDYEIQPKINRCMFHMNHDKLVQGRVYPCEHDGEHGIYTDFRNIVQEVLSQCAGTENYWAKKSRSEISDNIRSLGTHYQDYNNNSGCNISFLKMVPKSDKRITIGHNPICINCGNEHDNTENICCQYCSNKYNAECEECGERFRTEDNEEYVYIDDCFSGVYYCCRSCAEEAGWREIEVNGWWNWYREDDDEIHFDDYSGEYFHEDDNDSVETKDGNWFINASSAERADYVYVEDDGEWVKKEDAEECPCCNGLFYREGSFWNADFNCCTNCEDEVQSAIEEVADEVESELANELAETA